MKAPTMHPGAEPQRLATIVPLIDPKDPAFRLRAAHAFLALARTLLAEGFANDARRLAQQVGRRMHDFAIEDLHSPATRMGYEQVLGEALDLAGEAGASPFYVAPLAKVIDLAAYRRARAGGAPGSAS